jgi:hypothetical protein
MLASRTTDGLLGLDRSIDFSSAPLDHVVLVIHGLGDQYTDSPPWLTALETNMRQLQRAVNRLNDPLSRHTAPPAVLLVPLEYHTHAQTELARALRPSAPRVRGQQPAVRVGLTETVGDVLLAASPRFRDTICEELKEQALDQLAAVRRARPAFSSGRFSVFAHSTGAVYALHMLASGAFDGLPGFDALIMAGSPAPAYFALDLEYSGRLRAAVAERRAGGARVVNVYHSLDPASFRLEPWMVDGGGAGASTGAARPPVRVGQVDKQTAWKEATAFVDDTVQTVMSTLFPRRRAGQQKAPPVPPTERERAGACHSGADDGDSGAADASSLAPPTEHPARREDEGDPGRRPMRRNKSYVLEAEAAGGQDVVMGSEILLGDRLDYELQDGMDASQIDVVTNWAAVKAHAFYWRSTDVARILVDIARTSAAVKPTKVGGGGGGPGGRDAQLD